MLRLVLRIISSEAVIRYVPGYIQESQISLFYPFYLHSVSMAYEL